MPRACSLLKPDCRCCLSSDFTPTFDMSIRFRNYSPVPTSPRLWFTSGMPSGGLSKAGRSGAPTRAEKVYAEIRSDILNGRLGPGERLPFAHLGQRYQAST